jgi:glycosyltransferase involved in cell wall biosynthesis
MTPRVSVLMPAYNSEIFIREAISSIIEQSFSDYELIIIDDASTDDTVKIIRSFSDQRILLIEKDSHSGYTTSLNIGLKMAQGEYVARMDADDVMLKDRLKEQVSYMDSHPEVIVSGTWYKLMQEQRVVGDPYTPEEVRVTLLDYCCIAHPTVILRKERLLHADKFYNPSIEPAEDYDLWTRLIACGQITNLPKVLLHYRQHDRQVSNLYASKQQTLASVSKMRMLQYIIPNITPEESLTHLSFIKADNIPDISRFKELVSWRSRVKQANDEVKFFDRKTLDLFLSEKVKLLTRNFLHAGGTYNIQTLHNLYCVRKFLPGALSITSVIKIIVKSLIGVRN